MTFLNIISKTWWKIWNTWTRALRLKVGRDIHVCTLWMLSCTSKRSNATQRVLSVFPAFWQQFVPGPTRHHSASSLVWKTLTSASSSTFGLNWSTTGEPDILPHQSVSALINALLAEWEQIPAAGFNICWKEWNLQKVLHWRFFVPREAAMFWSRHNQTNGKTAAVLIFNTVRINGNVAVGSVFIFQTVVSPSLSVRIVSVRDMQWRWVHLPFFFSGVTSQKVWKSLF